MKSIQSAMMVAFLVTAPVAVHALEVRDNEFAWASELAQNGFEPFATSSAAKASFGMIRGAEMYVCFLADNREDQELRQKTLLANMKDDTASRTVPNLPFACVLAQ